MANQQAARALFRHAEIGTFFQAKPQLKNPYLGDGFLQRTLKRMLPANIFPMVSEDLTKFGDRICNELDSLADECENNPPYLKPFDAWGKRIDEIVTCDAWNTMKKVTAEEGIISIGYNKEFEEYSRLFQYAKTYLFSPSSGLFSCPIAMTDGAARTLQGMHSSSELLRNAYERLTSRDPSKFWTSGQWMTEKKGGSDVGSGTETIAVSMENGKYALHGYKWFSSATDSDMALTLARISDGGNVKPGSSGLSMFFLKTRKGDSLNNIQVMRLKNKLGTRQLPTGELLLDGAEAELISNVGRGIPSITPMLTITRIQNGVASVSGMRRILQLARDYSQRRVCFGLPIAKYPLHVNTMALLELETRGATSLLFETVRLLGLTENGKGSQEEEHVLRVLTPVLKLYTAKKGMAVMSEGLELFGGQGYIEDTQIPRHFRDAQVLPIWEGTTNILCLDVLRAIGKSKGEVLTSFHKNLTSRLHKSSSVKSELVEPAKVVEKEIVALMRVLKENMLNESSARIIAYSLAETAIGSFLIEHASHKEASSCDVTTAKRWVQRMTKIEDQIILAQLETNNESDEMVFDKYDRDM